jgi:type I restriction enzyme M protein
LQSRFPEARYADVLGLCKVADHQEVAGEQDYSLNPGRYVGVVIDEVARTSQEFAKKIKQLSNKLTDLNLSSREIEKKIEQNIQRLFEE